MGNTTLIKSITKLIIPFFESFVYFVSRVVTAWVKESCRLENEEGQTDRLKGISHNHSKYPQWQANDLPMIKIYSIEFVPGNQQAAGQIMISHKHL